MAIQTVHYTVSPCQTILPGVSTYYNTQLLEFAFLRLHQATQKIQLDFYQNSKFIQYQYSKFIVLPTIIECVLKMA